jgi:4-amino-4-deoxy-L-arabinose transferase-like glycosyltransferase
VINHSRLLHYLSLIVLTIFGIALFFNLGKNYLYDWDESIYAQLGVEMRQTHDFLTPIWNGDFWLEKPPMIAWVTALGQTIVPDLEYGSRLFMPVFAILTLYAVYQIGTILSGSTAGVSAMAILGYFNLFLGRGVSVNTDGMLLAAITWTVLLALKNSSPWKVALMISFAIMVKGPAGILAILIALPIIILKSKSYILHTLYFTLIFTLPWHLYQLYVNGASFYTPYLLEQVLRRATVPIEFHLESRWFYFLHLYRDLGLGVLLTSMVGFIFLKRKTLVYGWWLLLPLVLFTLAKTRLSWYILPVYPAIALLIGHAIQSLSTPKNKVVINILLVGMLSQMLFHVVQFSDFGSAASPLPDHIIMADKMSKESGETIAFLVSSSERTAEAILPDQQKISSSFRYGGAPSVVLYSRKHIRYYYNYDDFKHDLTTDPNLSLAIVTPSDSDKLPAGFALIAETPGYLGYKRGAAYAKR